MPSPSAYVGRGDLEVFMGAASGSLNVALADLACSAGMAAVRAYLGQMVTLVSDDLVRVDGTGSRLLRLPERPVLSVASVEEEDAGSTTWTTVPAADYVLRDSTLYRETEDKIWRRGKLNVRIQYSHGFVPGSIDSDSSDSDFTPQSVPADLVLATLNAARRAYESMGASPSPPTGVEREAIGSYSVSYASETLQGGVDLLESERRVLDRYRII